MEDEILEYIDEVRNEYPEVVADDEPIIVQSDSDFEESYIYQEPEISVLAISENKIENINEFKTMEVSNYASESDFFIRSSNAANDSVSSQSLTLDDCFDKTVLWTNSNQFTPFAGQTVNLSDYAYNYNFLMIYFNPTSNSGNSDLFIMVRPIDITPNKVGFIPTIGYQYNTNGSLYVRAFYYTGSYPELYKNITFTTCGVKGGSSSNNADIIPYKIVGLKYKENVVQPEEPETPSQGSVSNNYIYNYTFYVNSVSCNSVSDNIMTE